jgi:hypothetical protein
MNPVEQTDFDAVGHREWHAGSDQYLGSAVLGLLE